MKNIVGYLYGNTNISEMIKNILISCRLYYPYNLFYMYKKRKNKDDYEMCDARDYFSKNVDRINEICNYLSDELSVDVYRKLISMRQYYRKEDIPVYNYKDQYFPSDLPEFSENWGDREVFVDCGAFSGDICIDFSKRVANYCKIYAFEPDKKNIEKLENRHIERIDIIKKACCDYDGVLFFCEQEVSGGSHIVENGEADAVKVECSRIDSEINDEVTFIKMDIEGAEMKALRGAEETIKKHHPKLAISIYHSNQDMLDIPEYIHSIVPEYRMYVRAHTMGIAETILYCVADEK